MMELHGSHHFTARFDDDVVREALLTFVIQRTIVEKKMIWAAGGLMLVACLFLLIQAKFTFALLAFAVACFPALFSLIAWQAHASSLNRRYKRMSGRSAEITVDPEGFGVDSSLGQGRLNWNNVTDIWERPKSFMLFSGDNAFNILPRAAMPREAQNFLSDRASGR
ncbi:YcxB family protein [Rhizobium sp. XQZ8]|uniref:YcxB family protein n=1 Tax=Rhizobium populisoli TaxID=2859785 RepID=UPI001C67762D|nr:YcxB family protein [Rhizobium populisoli]MBW6421009.1 YcxB family protein [Rhizobium populisoli]